MPSARDTIAVDFDGVLQSYRTAFSEPTIISDPPVPGAIEWLEELTKNYYVAINSTRCSDKQFWLAATAWFRRYGLSERALSRITFPVNKPTARLYIDDRGFHFSGSFPSMEFVKNFLPWTKKFPK